MKIVTCGTIKGGVGKTVISAHVAAALADMGRKTLLMDLDPQGHATLLLGVDLDPEARCVGEALMQGASSKLRGTILREIRPNLAVAPGIIRMAMMERQLYAWGLRVRAVQKALETLGDEQPDIVIIDTPPHLGAFTEAALHAADLTIAPIPALAGSLQGFGDLQSAWSELQDGRGGILAAVVNLLDARTTATNSAVCAAMEDMKLRVLKTQVPKAEPINQAALEHSLLFDTLPRHPACEVFRELAQEIWNIVRRMP